MTASERRRNRAWTLALGALAIATVLALGQIVPALLMDDGVDRLDDPRERAVAYRALQLAGGVCVDPVTRVVFPALRVDQVEHAPGSCTAFSPRDSLPEQDYRARVSAYGAFGLARRSFTATCGGTHVVCRSLHTGCRREGAAPSPVPPPSSRALKRGSVGVLRRAVHPVENHGACVDLILYAGWTAAQAR